MQMFVAGLPLKPRTMLQVSPAAAVKVKESISPVVFRTQLVPESVSPETMAVEAGSVGQFFVVVAHPELGVRTTAKSEANSRPKIADFFMDLLRKPGC